MDEEQFKEQMESVFQQMPKELKVMEQGIDAATMMEFQKLQKEIATQENTIEERHTSIEILLAMEQNAPDEFKKEIVRIAETGSVQAFRFLEQLAPKVSPIHEIWLRMGVLHCRMRLENELSDEPVGFIATGLGGKGDKIRYYFAVKPLHPEPFTEGQSRWVQQTFESVARKYQAEIESCEPNPRYIGFFMLLSWRTLVTEVIGEAIEQCEDFLDAVFWITNVAKPSVEELETWTVKTL